MGDVVERAEALLEGVTPGPWTQVGFGNIARVPAGDYPPVAKTWRTINGDFVAAARELVPELVAELEKLRKQARLTVKSFREVEHNGSYDAPTHRCIDLLAEVAGEGDDNW